ncbi:MAG: SBBP repeat-containing protein [Armatimonadetes bacterium]|nr:SBBP repeat-containing protein [Armatimonadota bacterium]
MFDGQNATDRWREATRAQYEAGRRSAIRARKSFVRIACTAVALAVTSATFGQVQEEWVRRYNGPGNDRDVARALAVDRAGNVYVTGESDGSGTGNDYATLKYDTVGNELWERRYSGPGNRLDIARALAVDDAGNVYVTGASTASNGYKLYATLKYDTDGNLLWLSRYSRADRSGDQAYALAVDSAGNVYVTGSSSGGGTGVDYATLKYDTNGNLLWVRRYNGPSNDNGDIATAIAVDDVGNVYVTGQSWGGATNFDYATLKYDTNGNQLWVRRYDGPANYIDVPTALAVDEAGSVYVTGSSWGVGTDIDYATVKYNANGNLVWALRYNGPANDVDQSNALAVDEAGNVYVTGWSVGSGTRTDVATLKYDTNGNLVWERRYNGPANGSDGAAALALDSSGNMYVTGFSSGFGTSLDYLTLKYDTDGNRLWSMRYDGSGIGYDRAEAVAVDGPGNVYVTGWSWGSGTNYDYATIKYSQTVEVLPDSFSLFRGILTGGGLSDLLASDDSWMTVLPGITLNQSERQVQLIVTGTSPTETPTELRFRLEAHAEINNIGQWIELWNYDTNSYEQVDFMIATTVDSIVEVSITTDPARFVEAGTKQMRAKISYKEAGIVLSYPWLISFDQTVWTIVP